MCGILVHSRYDDKIGFERSLNLMAHRGPDDSGVSFIDGAMFGHRRLSILDLSAHGHQPMFSQDGQLVCVFNGEIYNFKEIREELRAEGYCFKSESDTEVLINAFHRFGKAMLDKLIGMFSFVIYDKRTHSYFAARDRLGIKPLYFYESDDGVIFSSEVKAIVALLDEKPSLDLSSVSSFLSYRYPLIEKSFLQGIKQVPPGHYAEVRNDKISMTQYWDCLAFASEQSEDRGEEYYLTKLRELFSSSVQYRVISDVPVGAYLSGGVDSSAVVAEMAIASNDPIKTFTIGFEGKDFNEFSYAREVADLYKTDHQEILLSPTDYLNNMAELIKLKDAPLGVPNEVPLYLMSKELKKKVTVVLSGEGADEIFGGYGRLFRSADDFDVLQRGRAIGLESFNRKYGNRTFSNHLEHFLHLYRYVSLDSKRSIFANGVDLDALELQVDRPFVDIFERSQHLPYATRMMYAFEKLHLPGLLQRVDATTMGASVEARVPFVDHRLVEFAFTIPEKYKLKWCSEAARDNAKNFCGVDISEKFDIPKYILKKALEDKLPKEVLYRKKMGFPVPLNSLLGAFSKQDLMERLVDGQLVSSGVFSRQGIKNAVHAAVDKNIDPMMVWMLLSLELYMENIG